jgi:hypothetical protein
MFFFQSIQIQGSLALVAFHDPAEHFISTVGAIIAGLLIHDPFFCAELPPVGDGPQYDFFADRHGKILNMTAGKFIAFMAAGIAFILCTLPDAALSAMHEKIVGPAAAAPDIVR